MPVAKASCALTPTEKRYAIELEALAIYYGVEKFERVGRKNPQELTQFSP